ncbi:unnamed protein product [Phytophthora lilii]|uniref:Unnamed protein product n=1 Tax=Phytophthora lilii TaxID=2077276 RepID=A0A9W6YGL0_9STRA|nr:unnamed protein product [Phytophthora lilii]
MLAISKADEFHAAVAKDQTLVACFSAPWCGGCKLVAPKVAALAAELAPRAAFVSVSAEQLDKLCEQLEVDSFPHFRVYRDGKAAGDLTSSKFDKVEAFVRGLVAPDTLQVEETPEETEESSKKRQERDEMQANDEQVAKKAKTEKTAEEDTEEAEPPAEVPEKVTEATEEAGNEEAAVESEKEVAAVEAEKEGVTAEADTEEATEEAEKEVTTEDAEKEKEGAAPLDKLEASEAAEVGAAPADAAAA